MASVKIPAEAAQRISVTMGAVSTLLDGLRMGLGLPATAAFNQQTMSFDVAEENAEEKKE